MCKNIITQERLKELLHYNPKTGIFTRLSGRFSGNVAGYNQRGYTAIRVEGVQYLAHRLAWLYMTGAWPTHFIDHKFGNRRDDRWINIRAATPRQNSQNRRAGSNSSLGIRCVFPYTSSTKLCVRVSGNHVGYFKTLDQALLARDIVLYELHGEFANFT